jgi:hypothetical protein
LGGAAIEGEDAASKFDISGDSSEQLIDDELGCGVDVVIGGPTVNKLVKVVTEVDVGELGAKVLFGERRGVFGGPIRSEAFNDGNGRHIKVGECEPEIEEVARPFDRW